MTIHQNLLVAQNPEEKETKNVSFQLLTGGKDGGDDNWLNNLEVGTAFLARRKVPLPQVGQPPRQKDPMEGMILDQYQIIFRKGNCTRLYSELNAPARLWVDTLVFSRAFALVEILGVVTDDGIEVKDPGTDRSSGLDDDARNKQTHQTDEP